MNELLKLVVLGSGGTGKTNVLEAISLLSSSKGLRSAKLEELKNFNSSEAIWSINSVFENNEIETEIGTYLDFTKETKKEKRIIKIDGNIISKKSIIDEYTSVIFLTPDMDQIFSDGLTSRRNFLDKICEFFFKHYSDLVGAYNKLKGKNSTRTKAVEIADLLFRRERPVPRWFCLKS
jgi:DNA replication and repair protein RecF